MGLFDRLKPAKAPLPPQPFVTDDLGGIPGVVTVRCTEGPTPDTVDQMLDCRNRGIVDITVVLDQDGVGDIIDPEIVELIEMEMLELAAKHGWSAEHVTVVRG